MSHTACHRIYMTTQREEEEEEVNRVNLFLHAENVRIFDAASRPHLPVTIVTGFLGAGKTTLLNHILTNKSNLKIAAAINDFAELNIDEKLVASHNAASQIIELSNGCVCCHLLKDLKDAVWRLLDANDVNTVSYLVVETSGISNPLEIIRELDVTFGKLFRARLDAVVCVVDVDQMLHTHASSSSAMISQLACADVIILNKIDLLPTKAELTLVEERIRGINHQAALYSTTFCNVPLSNIMDVTIPLMDSGAGGNAMTHEKSHVPIYVSQTGGALRCDASMIKSKGAASRKHSSEEFVSVSESICEGPLSLARLEEFVCSNMVQQLSRMKGILWIQGLKQHRCVLHLSGRGRLGFELDGTWTGPPSSDIAFIGSKRILDANVLTSQFRQCCCFQNDVLEGQVNDNEGLNILRKSKEFTVIETTDSTVSYFYLSGSKVYGYSEKEMERDLRIDIDTMNKDLADAVNASVNDPKAFLAYTRDELGKIRLCYSGHGEPANNATILFREANNVLRTHFRNVQVCKCGV